MLTKTTITRKLGVSTDVAWPAIEAVGRLDVWFPTLATCEVEGAGIGAVRRIEVDGGLGQIVDVIRSIDSEARRLVYERTESPFPVTSYVGTVEVFESYDGLAVVAWTVDFESEPEVAELVDALLVDAIGAGVAGMDTDLSG